MKSLFLVAVLLILAAGHSFAQATTSTFNNIIVTGAASVSGTAQINYLDVIDQLDIESNIATFGSLSRNDAVGKRVTVWELLG